MSTGGSTSRPMRWPLLLGLLVSVFAVAGLGSLATTTNVDGWYADAAKPGFTPPNSVFGPVWTALYAAMAVSAWLAHRAGASLVPWWTQLALNLAWSPTFFAAQWLWFAGAVIVALAGAIVWTIIAFWRHSRVAALLLVPYLVWVLYATALTFGIAALN